MSCPYCTSAHPGRVRTTQRTELGRVQAPRKERKASHACSKNISIIILEKVDPTLGAGICGHLIWSRFGGVPRIWSTAAEPLARPWAKQTFALPLPLPQSEACPTAQPGPLAPIRRHPLDACVAEWQRSQKAKAGAATLTAHMQLCSEQPHTPCAPIQTTPCAPIQTTTL